MLAAISTFLIRLSKNWYFKSGVKILGSLTCTLSVSTWKELYVGFSKVKFSKHVDCVYYPEFLFNMF